MEVCEVPCDADGNRAETSETLIDEITRTRKRGKNKSAKKRRIQNNKRNKKDRKQRRKEKKKLRKYIYYHS